MTSRSESSDAQAVVPSAASDRRLHDNELDFYTIGQIADGLVSPVGRFGGGSRPANSSRTALAEWSGSLGATYWNFSPATVKTDHSQALIVS